MWAETSAAAPGIVDRGADGCTVVRLLEPPLVVDDLISSLRGLRLLDAERPRHPLSG